MKLQKPTVMDVVGTTIMVIAIVLFCMDKIGSTFGTGIMALANALTLIGCPEERIKGRKRTVVVFFIAFMLKLSM